MAANLARWLLIAALGLVQEATPSSGPDALQIEGAVVCREIGGFNDYEPLPEAELTSDEKLLVYYLPKNYRIVPKGDEFAAHFTQDGQVRPAGKKKILLRKAGLLDYEAVSRRRPEPLYIRNTFSLKGLSPGEYEYDMILRDENGPKDDKPVTATVKFRVVAAKLPPAEKAPE